MNSKRKVLAKFSTEKLADLGSFYTVRMPVAQWIALPDHPSQRDTERQARKPHWRTARKASGAVRDALRMVTAAELDNRLTKVDGHTRALLWSTGELPDPDFVLATVYRCQSVRDLNELYDTFDSTHATKTKFDSVTGAYRQHALELTSHRLKGGLIVDALSIALRGAARSRKGSTPEGEFDISKAVEFFAPELQLLDSAKPRSETYLSGVVSGALLALALDRDLIGFFAKLTERGAGLIRDVAKSAAPGEESAVPVEQLQAASGRRDPVDALLSQVVLLKGRGTAELNEELAGQTLRAAYAWKAGPNSSTYWFSGDIEPWDIMETIREVKARKAG